MNITFLIGNGFDLNLGMKTAYTDIYSKYIKTDSATENLARFKKMLETEESCNYKTWSDFEMGMANHIDAFDSENDFIECIRDFKRFLGQQLLIEDDKCKKLLLANTALNNACATETRKSLESFYLGQTPNIINFINDFKKMDKQVGVNYNIISFNYTEVMDAILTETQRKFSYLSNTSILHVHGSLDSAIILGVDNIEQFKKNKFPISQKTKRTFIKPEFNAEYNIANLTNAQRIIQQSDIIYIYGMALGESDSTWIKEIIKWLIDDQNHILFYNFHPKPTFQKWEDDVVLDVQDEKRGEFFKIIKHSINAGTDIPLKQIQIPLTHNIFNYLECAKFAEIEDAQKIKPMGSLKNHYPENQTI